MILRQIFFRRSALCLLALLLGALPVRAEELWPELSSPPKATGGGEKDAAVIVGAEKYAFVESVPGARSNADAWHAYLTGTLKVPAEKVTLLRDDDATNDEIRQAAVDKAAQVEPGGTLWFVFIGHGAPSKDGKDGLLVGVDAQQKIESVYKRSLSRNELLGLLAKGKQDKTVVLIDACFSGKSSSGRALVANLQPLVAMGSVPSGLDARTILMTAARSDQFAGTLPKAGKPRPAFSYLALGALRGWGANAAGQVTAQGIVDYATKALSLARDRTQTPELSLGAPGSVLGQGRENAPDLAKLDREGTAPVSRGFQVSAVNLPAMPAAQAPKALDTAASGLNWGDVDVDALEKYNAALQLDKSETVPSEKAASWRRLAVDAPKFADIAAKRADEWDRYASRWQAGEDVRQKRSEARDADWEKLGRLLALDVVPGNDKRAWSAQFIKAYMSAPGVEPEMAKALAPYVAPGPTQAALKALALKDDGDGGARNSRTGVLSFKPGSWWEHEIDLAGNKSHSTERVGEFADFEGQPAFFFRNDTSGTQMRSYYSASKEGVFMLGVKWEAPNMQSVTVYEPPYLTYPKKFKIGAEWHAKTTTKMTMTVLDKTTTDETRMESTNRVTRREKVTVPAGTFDCYVVKSQSKIEGSLLSGGNMAGTTTMTYWFSPRLGKAVKYESDGTSVITSGGKDTSHQSNSSSVLSRYSDSSAP
jgi:hypothetical protein